ncbi:hypothetical protein RRG08_029775 [Elysia crispata]|uniref:Uncharacterized protein n=1 Tax=Elysia crispata TaxID=231223 RepID=A0AAE1EBM6_9GAST|nr:hypothetical protein RRG08_029775 [Elysia crispata]
MVGVPSSQLPIRMRAAGQKPVNVFNNVEVTVTFCTRPLALVCSCVCYSSTCMYVLGSQRKNGCGGSFCCCGCRLLHEHHVPPDNPPRGEGSIYWFVTLCVGHRRVQSSLWLLEENIHTMEKREGGEGDYI